MEKIVLGVVSKYDRKLRDADLNWTLKMAGRYEVIVDYVHNIHAEGLSILYNHIMRRHPDCHRFVFIHDDAAIDTVGWPKKINDLFDENPDYAIIGVAGSKSIGKTQLIENANKQEGEPETIEIADGRWWTDKASCVGRVIHSLIETNENKQQVRKTFMTGYSSRFMSLEEVAVIDGVFIALDNRRIVKPFDEIFDGFHMYDITLCLANFHENNIKIGVTCDILVKHRSAGDSSVEPFVEARNKMLELYDNKLSIKNLELIQNG